MVRSLVGRVCQDPVDQIVSSLVFDEIAFGPRNLGLSEEEVSQRVDCALRRVGLSGFQDRVTTALSGGEQQRIALAGVLAMTPRYLVLDEPTAQLDPAVRESLRTLFRTLVHEDGIGVALITHDPLEIALADRIVDVASINGALGASESACRASSGPQAVQHSFGSCTGREAARCRAVATPCDAPILEVGVSRLAMAIVPSSRTFRFRCTPARWCCSRAHRVPASRRLPRLSRDWSRLMRAPFAFTPARTTPPSQMLPLLPRCIQFPALSGCRSSSQKRSFSSRRSTTKSPMLRATFRSVRTRSIVGSLRPSMP